MVERLIAAVLLAAPALPGFALAQAGLADPTRPPSVAAAPGAAGAPLAAEPGPRLQSVLISPHRRLAVIDGRTVAPGAKVGNATLVQIAETHVTLRSGSEVEVLELHPGVVRKAPAPGAAKKNKKKETP